MNIRAKLAINVLSLMVFFLIIILVLFVSNRRIEEATEKGVFANLMVIGVSDMNTITYDYVLNPSERTRQQWERKHASLGELIGKAPFTGEEKRTMLVRIRENHRDADRLFKRIIENSRKMAQAGPAAQVLLEESNARNVAQLMARAQSMSSEAYALVSISYREIHRLHDWAFWLITAVILLSMAVAWAITHFIGRTINHSLGMLAEGTAIIAGGNLDYRIPVRGEDEISQLSRAFNAMTAELARSHASLGREAREKEKARDALQKAHDELEERVVQRTRELSLSEQRTSQILASITDCYYALDRDWRLTEINDQALRYFERKREELLGNHWRSVFPEAIDSVFEAQFRTVLSEGVPVAFEVHSFVVDRWAEVHIYPSDDGLSVYFRDITERKKAEQILRERTVELEAANRELEDFSYTVAHDLRAPLRAIDGFAAMLARRHEQDFDAESQRRISIIQQNVRNMARLIEDLLAYSSLGRKAITLTPLDMGALVREAWEEQCTIHPGRPMELRAEELPGAVGDRTMVRQVLANLLSNAAKFTAAQTPAIIEVGGREGEEENLYVVKDNGIGFDTRFHDKIFGVFQRLHSAEEYEGTGVGLAIVQRCIQRHGGRVWGEGKVNGGATFYFTLPRNREGHP